MRDPDPHRGTSMSPAPGSALLTHRAQLLAIYRAAFGAPPWLEGPAEVAGFAARLEVDARRYELVAALGFRGTELAGFAYGLAAPGADAYAPTSEGVVPFLDRPLVERYLPGALAVVELAVTPAARGLGLGRRLLTSVLDQAAERAHRRRRSRAWLVTHPNAEDALALYRRTGWQVVGSIPGRDGSVRLVLLHR